MKQRNDNSALSLGRRTGNARVALWVCGALLGLGFTARVEAVSISSSYDKTGKKLTVSITGQSENWDDLEIRCGKNDVVGTFATATANWSVDSIITRNGKKFCKLVRSSPISSDEDVEITHTDAKNRGRGGSISITLAGTVLTTKTGQASLLMVGACVPPGTDNCIADLPEEECDALGGTYLGDDTTTCPSGVFIPAVSDWGLVAMTLLVLTAATVVLLRRRAAAA